MTTHPKSDAPVDADEITARYHHLLIRSQPGLEIIINAMPSMAIVLNHAHQIVYANKAFLAVALDTAADSPQIQNFFASDSDPLWENILGQRIGDALNCALREGDATLCGTLPACKHCGIWQALNWNTTEPQTDPLICRLRRTHSQSSHTQTLLFNVSLRPLKILHWDFLLLVLTDISSEVHFKMLEHVLFNDIRDLTEGISSLATQLNETEITAPEEHQLICELLSNEAACAAGELEAHQRLIQAERGELKPRPSHLHSRDIIKRCIAAFERQQPNHEIHVSLDPLSANIPLETDEKLLCLIGRNMLYSALETTGPGDTIAMGCHSSAAGITFYVRTTSPLAGDARAHLFTRSFTTKDTTLGTNTYAMKLIGEGFLGGTVSCTSNADEGTQFTLQLPLRLPDEVIP